MTQFDGFKDGRGHKIFLPEQFFSEVVPLVDDLAELKVILFAWRGLMQREGEFRYLTDADFLQDGALQRGLQAAQSDLDTALQRAIEHCILLRADVVLAGQNKRLYFMNTPKGRTAVQQIAAGHWQPDDLHQVRILPERPTIYTLYEENIGPLTSGIAQRLKDAEDEFAYQWIVDAINIAIEQNARNWKYIRAILERWEKDGRGNEEPRRVGVADAPRYTQGKWADFIES